MRVRRAGSAATSLSFGRCPGDLDGDGRLTNFDIDPFVLALTNREAYQAAFPHIPPEAIDILGDMNGDGVLTNFDIDPFVDALVIGP
ncbi:MAG: hypothetical protein HRU75_03180 [Planctomycetia bacterium]|nr:MAG: hypothetical protein HRU75_03180 [Planctomycetia bacterium]